MTGRFASLGAMAMFALLAGAGAAPGASWDEKVFSSHVDFDAVAAAGASAIPALIERGRVLFKSKFTTADGAGRPKATQAIVPTRRKNGVNPAFTRTSGPDSNSCFGCHNDPIEGGSGDVVANAFVSEGFESAQFDNTDPSFSSERHTIALMGAGLVEMLGREMTADLQAIARRRRRAGTRGRRARFAPTSSPRACVSAFSSRIPTASSISTASMASTPISSCARSAARACSPRSGSSPSTPSTRITAWRRSSASAFAGRAATISTRAACPMR